MPNFTILAPNGKKYKVSGPNREGAIEALNNQLNPKKDSSLGTALEFGKLNTYANTNDMLQMLVSNLIALVLQIHFMMHVIKSEASLVQSQLMTLQEMLQQWQNSVTK